MCVSAVQLQSFLALGVIDRRMVAAPVHHEHAFKPRKHRENIAACCQESLPSAAARSRSRAAASWTGIPALVNASCDLIPSPARRINSQLCPSSEGEPDLPCLPESIPRWHDSRTRLRGQSSTALPADRTSCGDDGFIRRLRESWTNEQQYQSHSGTEKMLHRRLYFEQCSRNLCRPYFIPYSRYAGHLYRRLKIGQR